MDTRFAIPIYEDEDYNDALEYLINRMKSSLSGAKAIFEEDEGKNKSILERLPNSLLYEYFRNIISSCYGVNMPLMANYFRVEDAWNSRYKKHLIGYLKYRYIISIVDMDINAFALSSLKLRDLHNRIFIPNNWDPNYKWEDLNYTDNAAVNILNPINNCLKSVIYIISKSGKIDISDKFIDLLNHMNFKYDYIKSGENYGISINVLPCKTPVSLIKLVQLIHKYL